MHKYTILIITFLIVSIGNLKAQDEIIFEQFYSEGDSLRKAGFLKNALDAYEKSIRKNPNNINELYNYCCALAINGNSDSAISLLYQYCRLDTTLYPLFDVDFYFIHHTKEWQNFEDYCINLMNSKINKIIKDKNYAKRLLRMKAKDQVFYSDLEMIATLMGKESELYYKIWAIKKQFNRENQNELLSLIDQKGWPKISQVGEIASSTAFLIIQHASTELQIKYLPIIESLCKINEAKWSQYALMYDRIQTSEGKPQKYGSQLKYNSSTKQWELFPLLDANKVDEWRKEAGLEPLNDYIKRFRN